MDKKPPITKAIAPNSPAENIDKSDDKINDKITQSSEDTRINELGQQRRDKFKE